MKAFPLAVPVLLMISTHAVFEASIARFGAKWGCLAGFVFYWVFWCLLIPMGLIRGPSWSSLFRNRFPGKWAILLATLPLVGRALTVMPARLASASAAAVALSALIAIVNALGEQLLWGTYARIFPESARLGYLYPALALSAWHFVPNSFRGWRIIVPAALYLRLVYGRIARRTDSILWPTIFHALTDFTGLVGVFYLGP